MRIAEEQILAAEAVRNDKEGNPYLSGC